MPVAIIFAPIFVIVASVVIVRTGAVALQMTGLDRATASFQALSAFTNCGFTTREAESVVNHPQRRRIVRALMLLGNAGLTSTIAALVLSFRAELFSMETVLKAVILIAVVLGLYFLTLAKRFNTWLEHLIQHRLARLTTFSLAEFQQILQMGDEVSLSALYVPAESRLAGHTLQELALGTHRVLVLAIDRAGQLLTQPNASTVIHAGDRLICYGPAEAVRRIAAEKPEDDLENGKPIG